MNHCYICGKELHSLVPYKCKHCNQYFCGKHFLPEKHNCSDFKPKSWIKHGINHVDSNEKFNNIKKEQDYIDENPDKFKKGIKREKINIKNKKLYVIKNWFKNNSVIEETLIYLGIIFGLFIVLLMVHSNSDINNIVLSIFKIGSIIQLILLISIIVILYKKVLHNLRYSIKRLNNRYKIIIVIVFILFSVLIYQNPNSIVDPIIKFDYNSFNPFNVNLSNITWENNYSQNNEQNENDNKKIDIVTFEEINNHLAKYINKEIIIEGYVGEVIGKETMNSYMANFYDSSSYHMYVICLDISSDIDIYRGLYRIKGIVKESDLVVPFIAKIEVNYAENE